MILSRSKQAFTMIEMLVVIALIGGLVAFMAPRFAKYMRKAGETEIKYKLVNIKDALGEYRLQFGAFPTEREGFFNFCGHIHPGIKLKGIGRQYLNLSCFFQKPNQMILPAFGEFTGNFYLVPTEKDLVYGISKEGVFEVVLK